MHHQYPQHPPQLHLTSSQSAPQPGAPDAAYSNNPGALQPSAAAMEPAAVAMHAPQACGDAVAPKYMATMLQEMTRLANENTALKDQVKQHAPAAPSVLADNASLRGTIEDLRQQLQVKDHEVHCLLPPSKLYIMTPGQYCASSFGDVSTVKSAPASQNVPGTLKQSSSMCM